MHLKMNMTEKLGYIKIWDCGLSTTPKLKT